MAQAGLELEDNLSEAGITGRSYHAQLLVASVICYTFCACIRMCVPQCEFGAQSSTGGSQVSFYPWVPGVKCRSLDLTTDTVTLSL